MKKLFVWAMAALLIVPVACNKGGDDTWEAPATKDLAQFISFQEPVRIGSLNISSIELTEANRYIINYTETKASGAEALYGVFSFSGGVFHLNGFCTIEINGNQVTINPDAAGMDPFTVAASIKPTQTTTLILANLCRNWKPGKTIIGMSGGAFGQAGIEKAFNNGINMKEITDWASSYIELSAEDKAALAPYTVKELCLSGAGSIVVGFSSADPIAGEYKLNGNGFSFQFGSQDIPFISSGKVSGTITFTSTTCLIEAKATVVYDNTTYNASLEMTLTEAK